MVALPSRASVSPLLPGLGHQGVCESCRGLLRASWAYTGWMWLPQDGNTGYSTGNESHGLDSSTQPGRLSPGKGGPGAPRSHRERVAPGMWLGMPMSVHTVPSATCRTKPATVATSFADLNQPSEEQSLSAWHLLEGTSRFLNEFSTWISPPSSSKQGSQRGAGPKASPCGREWKQQQGQV